MSSDEDSLVHYPNEDSCSDENDWTHEVSSSDDESLTIIDIRVQQRNGRKSITTISGLDPKYKFKQILKDLKTKFHCNGLLISSQNDKLIIQLQGDHRLAAAKFLIENELCTKEQIKIHGS